MNCLHVALRKRIAPSAIPAFAQLQKILATDLPYFWLYESENAYAYRSDINDMRPWISDLAEYAWSSK